MNDTINIWRRFYKKNRYYHTNIQKLVKDLIPPNASILEIGSKRGELLSSLINKNKVGVEPGEAFVNKKNKNIQIFNLTEIKKKTFNNKFDYILITNAFAEIKDIQSLINLLSKNCHSHTRIVVIYFNFLWKSSCFQTVLFTSCSLWPFLYSLKFYGNGTG